MKRAPDPARNRELAIIHLGKKELGMERDTYEAMLWAVARVRSAADLDHAGREAVIDHLVACGFKKRGGAKRHEWSWVDRAALDKQPMLRKIIVLARGRGKPYVDAMAEKMFHVERLEFANEEHLRKIIAALEFDRRRHAGGRP